MDDQYRFEDFGFSCEPGYEDPLMPNFERKTLAIPGRTGLWDFGVEVREKPFAYPLRIMERFHDKMQQKFNELVDFLLDENGQPRNIKMVRDYEPDKYYTVQISASTIPERLEEEGNFVFQVVAFDPIKYASANQYDPENESSYGAVVEGEYYSNPIMFDWTYNRHYSGIHNYSRYKTFLAVEIIGTVTDPSVTNLVDNQVLTLPSIVNGKIEVKPKTFEIIKDGVSTLLGTNNNFLTVQPGEVGFLFNGENPNATVKYKWLHEFR
jgi:phage-related protein